MSQRENPYQRVANALVALNVAATAVAEWHRHWPMPFNDDPEWQDDQRALQVARDEATAATALLNGQPAFEVTSAGMSAMAEYARSAHVMKGGGA